MDPTKENNVGTEIFVFFFFVISFFSTRIPGRYSAQLMCTIGPGDMAGSVKAPSSDP